jgi:hypothetical protein
VLSDTETGESARFTSMLFIMSRMVAALLQAVAGDRSRRLMG